LLNKRLVLFPEAVFQKLHSGIENPTCLGGVARAFQLTHSVLSHYSRGWW
jgi:hypothetical protein